MLHIAQQYNESVGDGLVVEEWLAQDLSQIGLIDKIVIVNNGW